MGKATWIRLFREAGFVSDDEERSAPTSPLVAYRGASWGHRRGMSWTTNLFVASQFAERWVDDAEGLVFETTVPPEAVLALIGIEGGQNEYEVVVDPKLLPSLGRGSIRATTVTDRGR